MHIKCEYLSRAGVQGKVIWYFISYTYIYIVIPQKKSKCKASIKNEWLLHSYCRLLDKLTQLERNIIIFFRIPFVFVMYVHISSRICMYLKSQNHLTIYTFNHHLHFTPHRQRIRNSCICTSSLLSGLIQHAVFLLFGT